MASGAMTLSDITSADWSLMLDSTAQALGLGSGIGNVVQGVDDVAQCIAIILTTPQGSDPLRPTFGCDLWRFVDHPLTLATAVVVRETTAALALWEPRIKVSSVSVATQPQSPGHLVVSVAWQLRLGASKSSTAKTRVTI